jgi:hypothetical protein
MQLIGPDFICIVSTPTALRPNSASTLFRRAPTPHASMGGVAVLQVVIAGEPSRIMSFLSLVFPPTSNRDAPTGETASAQ